MKEERKVEEEVKHKKEERRTLTILYGSQTGSSEEVAERIYRLGKKRCFDCSIYSMNEYDYIV